MPPHDTTKAGGASPYKHPSVANLNGLSHLSRSTSTNSVPSARPAPQRSVSGSVETSQHYQNFTNISSPLATPSELVQEDPVATLQSASGAKRAMTGSPTVFGTVGANLPHTGAWSDSSGQMPSGASSVWNGRSGLSSGTLDGDALGTAATSTVSTPGRASTMGHGELAGNSYSRSPLASGESGAWPAVGGGHSPSGWSKDVAGTPGDYSSGREPSSSPVASKRMSPADGRRRQAGAGGASPLQGAARVEHEAGSSPSNGATNESARRPTQGGRALPKNPPVRSTTLDPSHLPGQRRHSAEEETINESGNGDSQLDEGMRNMTIAHTDQAPSQLPPHGGQAVMSPSSISDMPLQPYGSYQPSQPQEPYPQTPLQFVHAHRPSFGSFSPVPGHVDGFPPPPMPYYATANANRSPDGYSSFGGLGQLMPAMGGAGPAIDMSGYESYRTTPDPYAPPVPGRQVYISTSGPASQGSTPQSPSFGPSPIPLGPGPLRPNDAMFYPGPPMPYGGPGMGSGSMSPVGRHSMQPGTPQFGFGGSPSRTIPQSPSLGAVGIGLSTMGMPPPGAGAFPPQSPMLPGQLPPAGLDQRLPQGQYGPGPYRRSVSGADGHGSAQMLPGRPPFPGVGAAPGPGPNMAGPMGMPGGPMAGAAPAWNGRFPDHRRVPTGPGGVMTPPMGFNGPMYPQHPGMGGFVRPSGMHAGHPRGPSAAMGPSANGSRSPLLEEFRSRHAKNRKFELRDILGSVVEFSGDQHGSRFIQEKLDTATEEEKAKVFDELMVNARQLMTDVFGNYVIQKMLEHGDGAQRSALAKEMEGHVLNLSLGTYGCRVVQKAFEHTDEAQRIRLANELDGHILQCVKDQNANHVVQKVIEKVDPSKIDFVPLAFQGQVLTLAAHCYSCRVLQRIFEHCREDQSRPLLEELHAEAFRLMQDQYGNYVIQWVLQKGRPVDQAQVISKIKGQVLALSRHKFASNVIEEVIRSASSEDKVVLIEEILTPRPIADAAGPTASPGDTAAGSGAAQQRIAPAVIMMKDQFANYVLQRFLENAKGEQKARLVAAIRPQLQNMKRFSNGYAKHLAAIERLLDDSDAPVGDGEAAAVATTTAPTAPAGAGTAEAAA